ncbi:bifunctional methylenetetrahydrofolate dehydrogenase/methenyltetrahydrofolate cyclohydrolase FolD [Litorivicinus lipolyticus]|uniref:Bifunctional protein FolD n=1 Tax=Litorivicinus lipolyticus TaxID=418701 RepID=A0A5Q2QFN8_9GAMM|nr:bifunctional methylenetetrahydrofolate dehydrogenase/methenyltetrahydrofolate cyclohydrolase FolD [Litorivicinus lipolyticus]QGG79815.1 bifunctional methylenetetrahydrofolate dehydrogenase/methenyltetrahydrofolate cyclohydrolase FolD [Litorivicinus lipolyticus]
MTAHRIDGKAFAAKLRSTLTTQVADFKSAHDCVPGLAVVLVGEDPASQVYVGSKIKQTQEVGMRSIEHRLADDTDQATLETLIDALNADDSIDGILVQLPLPAGLDSSAILDRIDPAKDVDGFHPVNVGALWTGADALVPCTPLGCSLMVADTLGDDLSGLHAVVVGRSNIVGKPISALLQKMNATVTMAHSRTADIAALCRDADIVVAAVGRPGFVKADWIKPGATVIDVGINRLDTGKLVGDVDAGAFEVAGAMTPVPGGVGPMTIACLLTNTLRAAVLRRA